MFLYSAICDVPEAASDRDMTGRRAGTVRAQAKLVLRWFRDDAPLRQLAVEVALGYRRATGICTRASRCSPRRPRTCRKCWHADSGKGGRT